MIWTQKFIGGSLAWLLLATGINSPSAAPLPALNVYAQAVTISGVSSGAYMAVQMDVAYSKTFAGVGSVAGGPYWCAEGRLQTAEAKCMGGPSPLDVQPELNEIQRLETLGWIDPTLNLADHHVYIFASPDDKVVDPSHGAQLNLFYSRFLAAPQIQVETSVHAAHGFPTLQSGGPCDLAAPPYLLNCNYDTAGEILKSLYGPLKPRGVADITHLIKFSQQEFTLGGAPLYAEGWLYVPAECADQTVPCRLHVALHGCKMNPDFIQDRFATLAGYNEWAESNRIVILYPQVAAFEPTNPSGCWDWYGYTGTSYATQAGPEMAALKKMVDRLKGLH